MATQEPPNLARPEVNIVVCTDEYGCARWYHQGRNAAAVLDELRDVAGALDNDRVRVTTAGCILGCTYGPRFDVARRWSGEKFLYGSISGQATITRRGRVQFSAIPADLRQVVYDHLPESAATLPDLTASHSRANLDLLRRILLDCSRGIGENHTGFDQVTLMVHNQSATVSIPATLAGLEFVDGNGQPDERGDIAVLATDGDGRVALQLSRVRHLEFMRRTLGDSISGYSIWLRDDQLDTVFRIYLWRYGKPDANDSVNQMFVGLIEKYGATVAL